MYTALLRKVLQDYVLGLAPIVLHSPQGCWSEGAEICNDAAGRG